jgi:hypothetical protein
VWPRFIDLRNLNANVIMADGKKWCCMVSRCKSVKAPYVFETKGGITMPAMEKLNALLKSVGAPEISTGSLFTVLDAHGELQPWKCEGKTNLTATIFMHRSCPNLQA